MRKKTYLCIGTSYSLGGGPSSKENLQRITNKAIRLSKNLGFIPDKNYKGAGVFFDPKYALDKHDKELTSILAKIECNTKAIFFDSEETHVGYYSEIDIDSYINSPTGSVRILLDVYKKAVINCRRAGLSGNRMKFFITTP